MKKTMLILFGILCSGCVSRTADNAEVYCKKKENFEKDFCLQRALQEEKDLRQGRIRDWGTTVTD